MAAPPRKAPTPAPATRSAGIKNSTPTPSKTRTSSANSERTNQRISTSQSHPHKVYARPETKQPPAQPLASIRRHATLHNPLPSPPEPSAPPQGPRNNTAIAKTALHGRTSLHQKA